jgi:hypothetical protein
MKTLYSAEPTRERGCPAVVADIVSLENTTLWRQCRAASGDGKMCATHHAKMDAGLPVLVYRPVEGGDMETDAASHLTPEALVRASVHRSRTVAVRLRAENRDTVCAAALACERANGVRGTLRTLTGAAVAGAAAGYSANRNFWGDGGGPPAFT